MFDGSPRGKLNKKNWEPTEVVERKREASAHIHLACGVCLAMTKVDKLEQRNQQNEGIRRENC